MKKNKTLNIDRLKLCIQIKVFGEKNTNFKIFYVDEDIEIKNKGSIIYVNIDEYFRIRKGGKIDYSSLSLTLPTDITRDDFNHMYTHTFLTESVRKYLIRNLVKDLSKFVNNTFDYNPHSRIEYKNNFLLFY